MKRTTRTFTALSLAVLLGGVSVTPAFANDIEYTIDNPYAEVDWAGWDQYKSALHNHSYESDGGNTPAERFEDAYEKGFDVFALTDHNFTNTTWDRTDRPESNERGPLEYLTTERLEEMKAGEGREGQGMLPISDSNEQSRSDHLLTFWADFNNESGATLEGNIAQAEELGGVSVVAHPGRYTGGRNNIGAEGIMASSDPETVAKYTDLFDRYDSSVGMEIINKKDGDSASDRILWDNVLTEMMPERPVWGFSNDDAHSNSALDFSYNMHLMPELTEEDFRHSMETGAFYASAKISKRELGEDFQSEGMTPTIEDITVDDAEDTIAITGVDTESVRWISEGEVIAQGDSIDLDDHEGEVGSYVRAELVGPGGITFTQPFGVNGGPGRTAIEVAEFGLSASQESITPDETAQVTTTATDAAGNAIDLSGHTVAYSTDSDMVDIAEDGTVSVTNAPLANMPVRITVTALVDGSVHTDAVDLMIDVGSTENYTVSPIRTGDDDIEEYVSDGEMYFTSSDLEIANEGSAAQAIGLRFDDLSVPAGAEVKQAYVQFTTDEPDKSTEDFNVQIHAEATDDSEPFTAEAYDLTSREFSEDSVTWADIPLWTEDKVAGPDQQTPELAGLIQQVIDRDGWAQGNALTLKIQGEGNRSADAYESDAAPVLHVLWGMPDEEPGESEEPTPSESEEPTPAESEEPTPAESEEPTPAESEEPTPTESEEPNAPVFSDNEPDSAFFAPVQWMAANGISVGYADGTFKKNRDVSRGETTAFLHRYVTPEFTAPESSPFDDMTAGGAYFTPVTWAADEGITAGFADGTFGPSQAVTRGEFAAFLYRLAAPEFTAPEASPFEDLTPGGANYEAITWLAAQDITVGDTQGDFNQSDEITRAEMSAFMQRYDRVSGDN